MIAAAPGSVLEGLPFEAYFELEGESSTGLKEMVKSPLHYAWWREYGKEDRDALRLGRALHTATLEPQLFPSLYAIWDGDRRTGKEWEAFKLANADRTIIRRADHQAAFTVAEAIHEHKVAGAMLREAGARTELSITWTHERTGLVCKARIDLLGSALVDLKSCRDVSPSLFESQSARLLNHLQLSLYRTALLSLGIDVPAKIIACQSSPPYDVCVYRVSDEALVIGESLYERALDQVAECTRRKRWPGIAAEEELTLHLPPWALPNELDGAELTADGEALFAS